MFVSLCAPRGQPQGKVFAYSNHRKRTVGTFKREPQYVHVEIYTGVDIVDVKDQVIDCSHGDIRLRFHRQDCFDATPANASREPWTALYLRRWQPQMQVAP